MHWQLITERPALEALADRLARASRIAFDTEGASFHRYLDRVYLIQLSSDAETAVVDPLALADLEPIGRLLSDERIEVVFHDADYDLRTLDRDYGFRARRIFDTRIAAQLVGEPSIGLAALLEKYQGVKINKKLQRADWSRRPLPPDMLAYAAADTMHLLVLRDLLERQLEATGRLPWAEEEFRQLEVLRWAPPQAEPGYLKLKGAKALPPRARAVLRALHEWREAKARSTDRPPFKILGNDALLALARREPRTDAELGGVAELPRSLAGRYGAELLAAIAAAPRTVEDEPSVGAGPRAPRASPEVERRIERLKELRNARARDLRMEPGVLCPNGTLEAVARAAPRSAAELDRVPELRKWQREALGVRALLDAAA